MTERSPFKHFRTSPDIVRLAVMLYVRFPLSLRNVEDLLHVRDGEVWWYRFGPMFVAQIRKRSVQASITNYFSTDRSPSSRANFKLNRAAALEEWRGLCAG